MLEPDGVGRKARTEQSGWYRQDRKERTEWPEHDRRTGQLGQDKRDQTTLAGQSWQSSWNMTSWTWQWLWQWDWTDRTGQSGQIGLTGQPGRVHLDRTERTGLPGHDSGIRRAVDKVAWAEQLELDDCALKHWITECQITKRRISKRRIAKRRIAKRRFTKRWILQNVESYRMLNLTERRNTKRQILQNVKIQNVESYRS